MNHIKLNSRKIIFLTKLFGIITTLFSIYYASSILYNNQKNIAFNLSKESISILIFGVILSILSYVIIAYMFRLQVKEKYPKISLLYSFLNISISQIAKYLPGNFAHVLARGAMLKKHMSKADITLSFIIEATIMAVSTFLIGIIFFNSRITLLGYSLIELPLFALAISILAFLAHFFLKKKLNLYKLPIILILKLIVLNSITVLFGGLIIFKLSTLYDNQQIITYLQCTSAFSLSFFIGYVMPGAPAGIGVREAAFVTLLSDTIEKQVSLEIILLLRGISVSADIILFLIAISIKITLSKNLLIKYNIS